MGSCILYCSYRGGFAPRINTVQSTKAGRSLVRLVRAVGLVRFVLGAFLVVCVLLLFWAFLVSVWSFSVSAAFRAFAAVVFLLKRGVTLAVQRREVIRDMMSSSLFFDCGIYMTNRVLTA